MSLGKKLAQSALKLGHFVGILYGIMILFYIGARLTLGEQLQIVELFNSLMPNILFPAFIFALLALFLQPKKLALLHIPSVLLFFALYGAYFLPTYPVVAQDSPRISVMTMNISPRVADATQLIQVLRQSNAQIIALQELHLSIAEVLAPELIDLYPYQALQASEQYTRGVGIFSQFPIVDDQPIENLVLGGQLTHLVMADEQIISLLNVHPPPPQTPYTGINSSLRNAEIKMILDIARRELNPVLLVGDFNSTTQNDDYALITESYRDAFLEAGTGLGSTFPNFARINPDLSWLPPIIRIDYIFHSPEWTALSAHAFTESGGSDHYPVYAELALS